MNPSAWIWLAAGLAVVLALLAVFFRRRSGVIERMQPSTVDSVVAVPAAPVVPRERNQEAVLLATVAEAAVAIAREARITHDPREIFMVLSNQVRRITGCEGALLAVPAEASGAHEVIHLDPVGSWIGVHEGGALDHEALFHLDGTEAATRLALDHADGELPRILIANGFRTALLVPLALDLGPPALLVLAARDSRAFSESESEIVAGLASHLSAALRASHLHQSLERAISELERTRDYLVQSEMLRVAGEMASGVAHDFNNVLGAVLGRAQLLRRQLGSRTVSTGEIVRALDIIEKVARDGGETVRRLRLFGKPGEKAPVEPVDVRQFLIDAVEYTRPRWSNEALSAGRSIETEVDAADGLWVDARPNEMREVFTNLILNAVDALPEGGRIILHARSEGGRIVASVEDNGIGMTPETRRRLFEPFFTTKGPQGTGLGMSVTYGIVRAHGGLVGVHTERGHGTRIDVILPATRSPRQERSDQPTATRTGGPALDVLVIDDEQPVRELIGEMIGSLGHRATLMDNGLEAITEFVPGRFQVVLTDIGMPGVTGWHVAEVVRVLDSEVTLGFVTGWSDEISPEKLELAGVDAVIPKPFTFDHVQQVIERALARTAQVEQPAPESDPDGFSLMPWPHERAA